MTRLYALMYCFENSVRLLINERLRELHGVRWTPLAGQFLGPSKLRSFRSSPYS